MGDIPTNLEPPPIWLQVQSINNSRFNNKSVSYILHKWSTGFFLQLHWSVNGPSLSDTR